MINTIIFDLGGVLVDWNPIHLYRKVFDDEQKAKWFLEHVCNLDWNEEQDGGRSIADGEKVLIDKFPEWEREIKMYYERWEEMFEGPISGTVQILKQLIDQSKFRLYGLTNWSAELFPRGKEMFPFFDWFEGVVVSGEEGMKKPDHRIYQLIMDRYQIEKNSTVFIDDNLRNVKAAREFGIQTIHFTSSENLKEELEGMGIL